MHRARMIATLVAVLALSACSASEGATPAPSASPSAQAATLYPKPTYPCAAVPEATRKKFKLTKPQDDTVLSTGQVTEDAVVTATGVNCSWTVKNPPKGQNGRPNFFSLSLDIVVLTAEEAAPVGATPEQAARALLDTARADLEGEFAGVTSTLRRSEPIDDLGESAYYAVLAQEDEFGKSTEVVVAFRAANAYVKVAYGGADLRIDPSLPAGLQLVKSAVPPRRLKPVAVAVARDALEALGSPTQAGG